MKLPVVITKRLQNEIEEKANRILGLVRKGYKSLVFPNVLEIEKIMLNELRQSNG